jgi:hypothetical protein
LLAASTPALIPASTLQTVEVLEQGAPCAQLVVLRIDFVRGLTVLFRCTPAPGFENCDHTLARKGVEVSGVDIVLHL